MTDNEPTLYLNQRVDHRYTNKQQSIVKLSRLSLILCSHGGPEKEISREYTVWRHVSHDVFK
jgi:hypothetical protein